MNNKKTTKNIAIIGYSKDKNLGDPAICECCKYLVERIYSELNIPIK